MARWRTGALHARQRDIASAQPASCARRGAADRGRRLRLRRHHGEPARAVHPAGHRSGTQRAGTAVDQRGHFVPPQPDGHRVNRLGPPSRIGRALRARSRQPSQRAQRTAVQRALVGAGAPHGRIRPGDPGHLEHVGHRRAARLRRRALPLLAHDAQFHTRAARLPASADHDRCGRPSHAAGRRAALRRGPSARLLHAGLPASTRHGADAERTRSGRAQPCRRPGPCTPRATHTQQRTVP